MGKTRVEAFSDGVIVVAITLLALGLHVPPVAFEAALVTRSRRSGPTTPPTPSRF